MSFDTIFVPAFGSDASRILEIDNETGDTVAFHSVSDSVGGIDRDADGNVYAIVGQYLKKYSPDMNLIWTSGETYSTTVVEVADNGNAIFVGGGSRIIRLDPDGSIVWNSYDTNIGCLDMSYDGGDYLYVQAADDSEDRRYGFANGNDSAEELVGYNDDSSGILHHNGSLYSTELTTSNLWRSDTFVEGSTINDGNFTVSNYTNLDMDRGGLYTAGSGGKIAHLDFDGNTQWEVSISGSPYFVGIDVSPDTLWASSDAGLYRIDKSDGSVLWKNTDTQFNSTAHESLGGFPNLDSYGGANWEVTVQISGTATVDGASTSDVEILVIDEDSNAFGGRTTTDSNGNWTVEAPDSTLHVVAQYKDADGNVFNTESYPYVNS
ncbi:PQQ-binding-like beta-propeller repeat protein [Halorubrum sp. AJ67]|uniref:outer membrane protein assembly factor BamB family protein n=1 Tax=Halorubrum sp. AJ67 TaxID=1173487 RepID=UPI0003DD1B3D|nr:PQQ-binding-like beta-propeller repeat protein [Halorubrum sp. AJ67]CDK39663.1 hypothetical protein BN903_62 [Halorubrum sp. AJ67]